jgi:hypothetical protein
MPPKHNSRIFPLDSFEEFIENIGLPPLNTLRAVENGNLQMTIPFDMILNGNIFFNYAKSINALFPKYSYLSKAGEQKVTNHYSIKSFFMNMSDLGMKTQNIDRVGSVMFKVKLDGKDRIGGSLSLHDLGLYDEKDIRLFLSLFNGNIPDVQEKINHIYDIMKKYFSNEIRYCLAREIIEECTQPGEVEYSLSDIYANLEFVDIIPEEVSDNFEKTNISFYFNYNGEIPLKKYRELDVFPILWQRGIHNCYYTYSSRERKGYSLEAPYIHNRENIYSPTKFTERYAAIKRRETVITQRNVNEISKLLEGENNLEIGINTPYNRKVKNMKNMGNTQEIMSEINQLLEQNARNKFLQTLFSRKLELAVVESPKPSILNQLMKPTVRNNKTTRKNTKIPLMNLLRQPTTRKNNKQNRVGVRHPLLELLNARKKPTD